MDGFDKYGYPVKTGWLSPDYLKEGYAEVNIQPGMTYGSDSGWRISDDDTPEAKQFLACVKEVEYMMVQNGLILIMIIG